MIEFSPNTRFVANENKLMRCISSQFSIDWAKIPPMVALFKSFIVTFYHINCFCNKITDTFNITFENSLFMVAILIHCNKIQEILSAIYDKMAGKFKHVY